MVMEKGEQAGGDEIYGNGIGRAIKLDSAFLADNEESLLAAGYVHQSRTGAFPRGSRNRRGSARTNWRNNPNNPGSSQSNFKNVTTERPARKERPINPIRPNGRALTCVACGSYRHM